LGRTIIGEGKQVFFFYLSYQALWSVENKFLEKNLPQRHLSTIKPTWSILELNPGLLEDNPAINRLSYGTAKLEVMMDCKY
jgi:hypothetical protein